MVEEGNLKKRMSGLFSPSCLCQCSTLYIHYIYSIYLWRRPIELHVQTTVKPQLYAEDGNSEGREAGSSWIPVYISF